MTLKVLSGGAAEGLVGRLAGAFKAETGIAIGATFGVVGAMKAKLLDGMPGDLLILTRALIGELERDGHVVPASAVDIGVVRTGIAVRSGDPAPPVADGNELAAALAAADGIYFPDPKLATAGIHFAKVIEVLGIRHAVQGRLRPYPNGATAMRAMAQTSGGRLIGCTQVTEILATPGVTLVASLPGTLGLATVYTAAVAARAKAPHHARRLAAMLASPAAAALRREAGFEDG
jgi:molybdate transport system substrate-binding protein